MSYSVIASADVLVSTTLNKTKNSVSLPAVAFGTRQAPVYPYSIATRIGAGDTEEIDLSAKGYLRPRVILVKATRPVRVSLEVDNVLRPSLLTNFLYYVINTTETIENVSRIVIEVPPAPVSAPPGPPVEGYPGSIVEVFIAAEDPT